MKKFLGAMFLLATLSIFAQPLPVLSRIDFIEAIDRAVSDRDIELFKKLREQRPNYSSSEAATNFFFKLTVSDSSFPKETVYLADELLKMGFDPFENDVVTGESPFYLSMIPDSGKPVLYDYLKKLPKAPKDYTQMQTSNGSNPLSRTVINENLDSTDYLSPMFFELTSRGVDPKIPDPTGSNFFMTVMRKPGSLKFSNLLKIMEYEKANFTKSDLDKILKEKAPKSIDELLSYIPDEYKKYNAMMFQSNSGQKASTERPRMILFGKDARLLLAFNGDPKHKGYDKLEIIEFNPTTNNFEFHEIDEDSLNPKLVIGSTQKCADCHNKRKEEIKLRPNFDSYFFWKGAVGAVDDEMVATSRDDFKQFDMPFTDSKKDVEALNKFLKAWPNLDRYKQIPDLDKRYNHYPDQRPNLQLTASLYYLHARSLAQEIVNTPGFKRHPHLYLLLLSNSNSFFFNKSCQYIDHPDIYFNFKGERIDHFALRKKYLNSPRYKALKEQFRLKEYGPEKNLDPANSEKLALAQVDIRFLESLDFLNFIESESQFSYPTSNYRDLSLSHKLNSQTSLSHTSSGGDSELYQMIPSNFYLLSPTLKAECLEKDRVYTCEELEAAAQKEIEDYDFGAFPAFDEKQNSNSKTH